jgi:hypothetical protein
LDRPSAVCDSYRAYPWNSKVSSKNVEFLTGAATDLQINQLHAKIVGVNNKSNNMDIN